METQCGSLARLRTDIVVFYYLGKNPHYTRGITPKRVTSGGLISAAMSLGHQAPKKCRSGGEPLGTDLIGPEIELQTSRADSDVFKKTGRKTSLD